MGVESARFDVDDATGGCAYLRLRRLFPGTFSASRTRLSIFMTRDDVFLTLQQSGLGIVLFQLPDSGHLSVFTQSFGANVSHTAELGLPAFGRWLDLIIDVETQPSPRLRVNVDGIADVVSIELPVDFSGKDPAVGIGHWCAPVASTFHVDDFVFELAP